MFCNRRTFLCLTERSNIATVGDVSPNTKLKGEKETSKMNKLKGKVAIVTGASKGIGAAIAKG